MQIPTNTTQNAENISEKAEMTGKNKSKALSMKKEIKRKVGPKSRRATLPSRVFQVDSCVVNELLELDNGNMAVTSIDDNNIRIFDFITGRLKKVLINHQDYIMEILNIPSKKIMVSSSCDKTVKLWCTRTFKLLRTIERSGLILSLHIMNPEVLLIQESKATSFFVPSKVTEVVSVSNGTTLKSFEKSANIGKILNVLPTSKVVVLSRHGDPSVKF